MALAGTALLSGCSTLPLASGKPSAVRRVGILNQNSAPPTPSDWPGLVVWRQQMAELGWIEGQNLLVEFRHADGVVARLPELATELVQAGVEVIYTSSTPEADAARQATKSIPIVAGSADPVRAGLVQSLARPGGNVTAYSNFDIELNAKRIELLKECVPRLARMAVLRDIQGRGTPMFEGHSEVVERSASGLGIEVLYAGASMTEAGQVETAISGVMTQHADGLYVASSPQLYSFQPQIAELAVRNHLPSIAPNASYARAGVLMGYAANEDELKRRSAVLVDKILRGANPAELPVERATKFDFAINLKTAGALGITVPQSLLQQATELIQ
jgi:putative ABC transport system substrate-binding protein